MIELIVKYGDLLGYKCLMYYKYIKKINVVVWKNRECFIFVRIDFIKRFIVLFKIVMLILGEIVWFDRCF